MNILHLFLQHMMCTLINYIDTHFCQLDEGFPRNVKNWYRCDGYRDDMGDTLREDYPADNEDTDSLGADGSDVPEDDLNDEENDDRAGSDDNGIDHTSDGDDSDVGERELTTDDMPEELDNPELCTYLPQIDAITVMGDGLIYAFSGKTWFSMNIHK